MKLTFFIILILPFFSIAQSYIPFETNNAQWNCWYSEGWELGGNHGYDSWTETYYTSTDTIINGTTYTQLIKSWIEEHATYYGTSGPPVINYVSVFNFYQGAFRND